MTSRLLYPLLALATACRFEPGTVAPVGDAQVDSEVPPDAAADAMPDGPPPRVTSGLVALYTFEEGSGTTVVDRSGVGEPLDLTIRAPTSATWGDGTLTLTADNLVASADPATKILDACRDADALTLEAWIEPTELITAYFPRVVTLSTNSDDLALTLMAIDSHFEFRMRGPMTDSNGLPSLNTAVDTVVLAPMHVVLVSEPGGARRIYIDGVEAASDALGGDLASWGAGHRFGLGNEIDGGRAWLGTFDLVAVYARALDSAEIMQNLLAGPR